MIAHVGGVPVEETLLPLVGALGAGLLLARAWVMSSARAGSRSDQEGWKSETPP